MKVRRVSIERMPGVEGLAVDGFGDSVTVVTGANESGKSSLVRALRALLWGDEPDGGRSWDVGAIVEGVDGRTRHVLREGGRTWWTDPDGGQAEAPLLPDARYAGCFTIEIDALGPRADADAGVLARQLRTELSGGVDMAGARERLAAGTPTGVSERAALRKARTGYAEARQRHRELDARRQRLAELEARRDAAAEQARRHGLLEHVVAWREALEELEQVQAQLAALPTELLANVHEGERAAYDRMLEARDDADRSARDCSEKAERLAREIEESPLDEPVPRARLEELAGRVVQLERAQAEHERLLREHDLAHGRHVASAGTLAAEVLDDPRLDGHPIPSSDIELARRIAAEHATLDALEAAHERRAATPAADERASSVHGHSNASATHAAIIATALAGSAAAAWVGITAHRAGWGVLVLVLACAYAALRSAAADRGTEHPEEARIARRVDERRLAEERRELDERRIALERRGDELATRLGLQIEREPGAFADWLHRIATVREAANAVEAAREACAGAERSLAILTAAISAQLGDDARLDVVDAVSARAAVAQLERDSQELAKALAERPRAHESLRTARESAARAREHLAAFRKARGIPPQAGDAEAARQLRELWALEPAYRALKRRMLDLEARRDAAAARIPDEEQDRLRECSLAEVIEERDSAALAADHHVELVREVERDRGEVLHASRGFELTDALCARDEARAALEARRDEAMRSEAAAFLVDWAAGSYERDNALPIVADANRILESATAGRYSLAVVDGELAARDSSGVHAPLRRLDQLSTGTRAQLLVAARVAFARHAEREERLPIFVDEALTTTDPDRFDAVVASLADIAAADGRQVVYLTSNPDDAARVQAVLERRGHPAASQLELGHASSTAGAAEASLRVAARQRVPAPIDSESSTEWAARIGVPPLDPHRGADAAHLWHLHEPDVALLHRLLDQRIETLGPARALDRSGLLSATCSDDELECMRATWRAWDAFVAAWLPGRGRRLVHRDQLRAVLDDAGVSVATWLERIWPFVDEADGDPAAIDAMWANPDRGFNRSATAEEKLRMQLQESAYLPTDERLDDATVLASVRSSLGGQALLLHVELDDLVHAWLERATPAGAAIDASDSLVGALA